MKKSGLFGRGKAARSKESRPQDYKSLFMRDTALTARSGKTVYISNEHHRRITKILQVIGKNEVSMFAFLHHVLEHHFETYREEITDLHEQNIEQVY